MAKASSRRMTVLLALAVVTALLSYYSTRDNAVAAPLHRRVQAQTQASSPGAAAMSEVDVAVPMDGEEEMDPFAPRGWLTPPPVQETPRAVAEIVPPQAPAAPPGPPPLPYKFMGRMNDGGDANQQMVYLSKGDQVAVVQGGETLDETYRVLHVEPDHIEFEHIPSGEKQTLNIAVNDK